MSEERQKRTCELYAHEMSYRGVGLNASPRGHTALRRAGWVGAGAEHRQSSGVIDIQLPRQVHLTSIDNSPLHRVQPVVRIHHNLTLVLHDQRRIPFSRLVLRPRNLQPVLYRVPDRRLQHSGPRTLSHPPTGHDQAISHQLGLLSSPARRRTLPVQALLDLFRNLVIRLLAICVDGDLGTGDGTIVRPSFDPSIYVGRETARFVDGEVHGDAVVAAAEANVARLLRILRACGLASVGTAVAWGYKQEWFMGQWLEALEWRCPR